MPHSKLRDSNAAAYAKLARKQTFTKHKYKTVHKRINISRAIKTILKRKLSNYLIKRAPGSVDDVRKRARKQF